MHNQSNKNPEYNRVLTKRLEELVVEIIDAFDPQEIIMYGSYARGDNDIYSDIDLIIIAETNLRFQDRSLKALDVIDGNSEIPINPIIYTPKEFEMMLKNKESFLISALEESILLWRRDSDMTVQSQLDTQTIQSEFKKYL